MGDIASILEGIEAGDPQASEELLPLVYGELRCLARQKLHQEKPGHTLQATALVHEAYLRLVGTARCTRWDSRAHFIASAAEAMRRILIDDARRKQRLKRGGGCHRVELRESDWVTNVPSEELLAIDEAVERLSRIEPQLAELVKLRFFVGYSLTETAGALGISRSKAYEQWAFARAWLKCEVED